MALFAATSLVTAIGGATFAASTLGSFAIAAVSVGFSIGASQILSKYVNRQKKQKYSAFKSEQKIGGDVPRQSHFGIEPEEGHYVRYFKWGSGNKYNADVIVLSDGWCDGLEPYILLGGEKVNLVSKPAIGSEKEHWEIEGYEGITSIRYFDGNPAQVADAELIADTGGSTSLDPANNVPGAWNGTDIGANMAYVIYKKTYSPKWKDLSLPKFIHRGLRVYDPRLDVLQGGTHVPDDPSTWEFSVNGGPQRTTYLCGAVTGLVSGRTLIGMGKPVSHIDVNAHIVAANVCDETRVVDGRTVVKYHCNLTASGLDDHSEVLKDFDDSMAGYGVNRGGLASIVVGAPQLPVLEITEDDIIAEAPVNVQYRKSSANLYNIFTGQFLSPDGLYTPASITPVSVNADIAADKHKNQIAYDFMQVRDPAIAQYLLNIRYRQNRKGATASFQVFERIALRLNAGDWITWRGDKWMVSNEKGAALQFVEVGDDTFSETGIDAGPVVIPPTTPSNPSVLSTVQGFNAEADITLGDGVDQTPILRFTWTPPDDPTITGVIIRYYDAANISETFEVQSATPERGVFTTSQHIESNRVYIAQATIRTIPDRRKTYTALMTTAATPRKSRAVTLAELTAEVKEALKFAFREISVIKDRQAQLSHSTAQTTMHQLEKLDKLEVKAGGARSSIKQTRKVAVTAYQALAESIETVQSNVGDVSSSVTNLIETIAENDEATALAFLDLIAQLDAVNLAQGLLKFEVVASEEGVSATIAMFTRVGAEDDFAISGFYIHSSIVEGVFTSEILAHTDKFSWTDGTNKSAGMTFQNGILRLDVADIGNITTGVIDLQEGYIIS